MSKIARPLLEFADIIRTNGIECNEELSPYTFYEEVDAYFTFEKKQEIRIGRIS